MAGKTGKTMFTRDRPCPEYWKFVSKTVNYDGYHEWYMARGCGRKFFWTIIMIGTISCIAYYVVTLTGQYLARPSGTQVQEKSVSYMPFPNVTICQAARFNRTYLREKIYIDPMYEPQLSEPIDKLQDDFAKFFGYLTYVNEIAPMGALARDLETMYQAYFTKAIKPDPFDLREFVLDAGFQCKNVFIACSIGGQTFDCCAAHTTTFSDYGACYQLDVGATFRHLNLPEEMAQQSTPGASQGLKIYAQMKRSELPPFNIDTDIGMRVHLNERMSPYDSPIFVPPHKMALIRTAATKMMFDPQVDLCVLDVPDLHGVPYTQEACIYECLVNISQDTCGCTPIGFDVPLDRDAFCTPRRMAECVLPLMSGYNPYMKTYRNEIFKEATLCANENCPSICKRWDYESDVTYMHMYRPPDVNASDEYDYYGLSIFYGEIKYTTVQTFPLVVMNTFIWNLGGLIGLWTGMSMVTVIQVLIYCYFFPCCYEGGVDKIGFTVIGEEEEEKKKAVK